MATKQALTEWIAEVTRQLSEAGFTVTQYQGFPIVERPAEVLEMDRLIKFHPDIQPAAKKEIYSEGMLFIPNLP